MPWPGIFVLTANGEAELSLKETESGLRGLLFYGLDER